MPHSINELNPTRPAGFTQLDRPTSRDPQGNLVKGLSPVEETIKYGIDTKRLGADVKQAMGDFARKTFGKVTGLANQMGGVVEAGSQPYKRVLNMGAEIYGIKPPRKNYDSKEFVEDILAIGAVSSLIFGGIAGGMTPKQTAQPTPFTSKPLYPQNAGRMGQLEQFRPAEQVLQGIAPTPEIEFMKRMGTMGESERQQFAGMLKTLVEQNKTNPYSAIVKIMDKTGLFK